jgi:hypothetical protein
VPLYGCAALLIREIARRGRLGWTGILLLAAAFGLVEAGLVDQSLFSPDYRGLEGWEAIYQGTLLAPLGLSLVNLIGFVGGHVMLSVCGPIALVEAWRPGRATQPWLRLPGLVITAVAYAGASLFVLRWHLQTESWHAGAGQLVGAAVVVLALVVAAVLLGRRSRPSRRVPGPGLGRTALVSLALATAYNLLPQTWAGAAGMITLLVIAAVLLARASRTERWSPTHAAVVGAAPLLLTALLAFTYDPLIGEVTAQAKYAHNAVMLTIVLTALGIALLRREVAPAPHSVFSTGPTSRARRHQRTRQQRTRQRLARRPDPGRTRSPNRRPECCRRRPAGRRPRCPRRRPPSWRPRALRRSRSGSPPAGTRPQRRGRSSACPLHQSAGSRSAERAGRATGPQPPA